MVGFNNDYMAGLAIGRGRQLAQANQNTATAYNDLTKMTEAAFAQKERADAAEATLEKAVAANEAFHQENQALLARIAQLEAELAKQKGIAAGAKMDAAGRKAQFDALKAQHPDSPLFQDSDKQFKDGVPKTKARVIYEAAFDQAGRQLGISNPADLRED